MKQARLCGRVQRGVERLKICIQSADLKPPAYLSSGPGFEGLKTEFKPHNASAAATSAPFPTPTWDLAQPGTAIVCVCVFGRERAITGCVGSGWGCCFFLCVALLFRGESVRVRLRLDHRQAKVSRIRALPYAKRSNGLPVKCTLITWRCVCLQVPFFGSLRYFLSLASRTWKFGFCTPPCGLTTSTRH